MTQSETGFVVLYCTIGSMDEASRMAEHLVGNHLAACVNIVPSVRSVYWWNNRVYQDNEVLMIIKTKESRIPEVETSIRKLHSYQTPELIAIPIQYGIPEYMEWMSQSLTVQNDS